jgi:hypothetical protein
MIVSRQPAQIHAAAHPRSIEFNPMNTFVHCSLNECCDFLT